MKNGLRYFLILTAWLQLHVNAQTPVSYFGAIPDLKVSGKEFVDPTGKAVTLHGVMDTPNCYFNSGRWGWISYDNPSASDLTACKNYFTKVFQAIANPAKGSYCNLFRLHLDPAWLRDKNIKATGFTNVDAQANTATDPHGNSVREEANICHFSYDRMRARMQDLYVPIIKDALAHGLYVVVRPPGVFPEKVTVGDYYNEFLIKVWDIFSSDSYVKSHSGQIMIELGNEPVDMNGNLADYFQPVVNKIRQNGFNGIILLPGTSWQADYRSYNTKPIQDSNFGYAVHNYPGWYGGWDANQSESNFISTFEAQVPVDKKPIVITEVDWSPMKKGAGHWNEAHTQYTEGNFGTWGTGTTNSPAPSVAYKNTQNTGWGMKFKHLVDKHPNISWTLQGTTTYVDIDTYLKNGTVQPAFTDQMKAAGYQDASEACSGACFSWYKTYACGDRIPYGTPSVSPDTEYHFTSAQTVGNASFDEKTGHYCFYTTTYSSFVFDDWKGTRLAECAELVINQGKGSTIGYRLDVQIIDSNGKDVVTGTYVIGTEAAGTRSQSSLGQKTYRLYEIFADYLKQDPGCTVGSIRLNTVVSEEDTDRTGKYWFTLDDIHLTKAMLKAEKIVAGTSLEDIPLYGHSTAPEYYFNNNSNLGGWGNGEITNHNNGSYTIVVSEKKNPWEGQFNLQYDDSYPKGTELTLSLDIKGSVAGTIGAAIQNPDGYVDCGNFPSMSVTTSWKTVTVMATVTGDNARRVLLNYGDYLGTLDIRNIKLSYMKESQGAAIEGQNIRLNEAATNGAEIFGAGLIGNVAYSDYADLSDYKKMVIKGSGGSLRVLYNRPATGTCPELNPTLEGGEAVIDLSAYPYFHLNSIKVGWGQTATVTSIRLYSEDSTESEADYIIAGYGYEDASTLAALGDKTATVIDITGYASQTAKRFESANPNCLLVYKDGSEELIGGAFDERNVVKKGYDYSAWRIDLVDDYNFRSPYTINTVGGASYKRTLPSGTYWGTMSLPFELDLAESGQPAVYVLSVVNDGEMRFNRVSKGKVAAGSVILYYNAKGGQTTLSGKGIAPTAEGFNIQPIQGVDGWYTAQSFSHQVIADVSKHPVLKDYEVYGISQNEMIHATRELTLKPFRAFYLCKKSAHNVKASFTICLDDTDMDDVTGAMPSVSETQPATEVERYDVMGRRLSTSVRGLNFIRMSDGSVRKVMRK